jgi:hypothetical protein
VGDESGSSVILPVYQTFCNMVWDEIGSGGRSCEGMGSGQLPY